MSDPTSRLFGRIWADYLRVHAPRMSVAFVFMAIEGSTLAVLSWMLKPLFDRVFVGGESDAIWWVGGIIFGLFCVRAITLIINRALLTSVAQAVAQRMQGDLMAHIMRLDGGFFQANPPGALIERVQGDTLAVQNLWQTLITGAGRDVIALLALFVVALRIDPMWTLVALVGVPILIAPSLIVQRYIRRKMRLSRNFASERATRIDEVLHGIDAVKLNGIEPYQSARFNDVTGEIRRAETKIAATGSVIPALVDVTTGLGFLGVLALGGHEVTTGARSVGDFMAFFTALSLAFQPLRRLGQLTGAWQVAATSLERLYAVFDAQPAITSGPRLEPPPSTRIELEDVRLSYDGHPVLRGLSLVAEPGQTTAIVGPSGAGKSTVFRLLTRLADPDGGRITLGGVDLAAFDLAVLRRQFSTVAQEAALFDESLRDNIMLGGDAAPDALDAAIGAAHLREVVAGLPGGLDYRAGPRGSALSGGQRQRVAIARAVLRNAPILLLDEATSALDTQSERMVQTALEGLAHGRTTLVIAHRLSTVRNADKIIVIEDGRVVQQGNHEALMAEGGTYAELVRLQFGEE